MSRFIDLTGHKYGRVTVVSYFGHKNGRTALFATKKFLINLKKVVKIV